MTGLGGDSSRLTLKRHVVRKTPERVRTETTRLFRPLLVLVTLAAFVALVVPTIRGPHAQQPAAPPHLSTPSSTGQKSPAARPASTLPPLTATDTPPAPSRTATDTPPAPSRTATDTPPFIVTAAPGGMAASATAPAAHAPAGGEATSLPTATPIAPTDTPVPALATSLPTATMPMGALHTEGTRVVDAQGRTVTLATVNWYGAEGPDYIPGGLDKRPYMDILLTIRTLGFNSVRLPFSDELVERNPRVYEHLQANKSLVGLRALEIMDVILDGARRAGIMVILDNHRSDAGWSALGNGLWYTQQYPESHWIADWVALATRYRDNPAVVGADLRNEPHSNGPGTEILGLGYLRQGATWGPYQGVSNPASDWRPAAERAGNAALRANPHLLIIVEGTEIYPRPDGAPDIYWWGGNLRGAMDYPVHLDLPGHLVYSAHEYGPRMHSQRWFTPTMGEEDWFNQFEAHWGSLLARTGPDAAPVWIGEFGTPHYGPAQVEDTQPASQGQWFTALVDYLKAHPSVGWSFWAINGTISGGANARYGKPETYGLLTPDWTRIADPLLLNKLRSIEPAQLTG